MATINGTAGNDVLTGTDVDFFGNGGDDTIHGAAGNDTIDGLGGSNQIFGDDGDDVIKFGLTAAPTSPTHSAIDGGTGYDTLDMSNATGLFYMPEVGPNAFEVTQNNVTVLASVTGIEQIILGNAGEDSDSGSSLRLADWTTDLKVIAHGAFNAITTGLGNDTIIGGDGNDVVNTVGGNDNISLGAGQDQAIIAGVSGHADHVTIDGGAGPDDLLIYNVALQNSGATIDLAAGTGSVGQVTLSISNIENVYVDSSSYGSTVYGDDNANGITGSVGAAVFDGRGGDDRIRGGSSGDHLAGGDGNDTIDGLVANDQIPGGAGDDVLYGGSGNNLIDGGDGNDWIDGGGQDTSPGNSSNVENGSDTISGGAGNDHIWGSQPDTIGYGLGGAQWTIGSVDAADSIDAGDGSDYVNGNAGADTIHGGAGGDRLYGGDDDDVIYGDDSNDHINGNKGNDTIDGGAGGDVLLGGQGNDQILGGDGDDIISGDIGADTIHGGAGFDYMTGGTDADVFAFSAYGPLSLSEAPLHTAGPTDVVADYQDGVDKFSLGFAPAAVLAGTALTPAAAAVVAQQLFDGHAGDHEVAAVQVGADTYLFFSATGGGGVNSEVQVVGVASTAFDTSDFV
ncbi:MAG TPA: calcium-binding protein [Sphingomonas sp.]|uniref:calcium-binding protein n=1 Tax=Sphingomonas sp. TaxID=28214 RepID=UPI002BE5A9FE|nr:calcium-binding protein [Sphingomonas sp.]HMI21109.1 calcium-binding protein [Sphingomonas sp.]